MHLIDTLTIRTIDKYLYQQGRTKWTQLCYQEKVLCNSLEWVDPLINPVQVMLCETSGIEGCSSHGYVHISSLDHRAISSHLQQVISWFELAPDETLNGKLVLVDSLPAQVKTIYLNDPPQEWYPFAIAGGQVFPAFGKEWLYLEES